MILLLIFLFLIFAIIGLKKTNKWYAPIFVVPFLWAIMLFLYNIIPSELYRVKEQFILAISLWITSFWLFGFLIDCFFDFKLQIQKSFSNKRVRMILCVVVFIMSPLMIKFLVLEALNGNTDLFFLNLREINTGVAETKGNAGILKYVFNIAYATFLIELLEYRESKRINKIIIIGLFICNIILCLMTVARTGFVNLFVSSFIIMAIKGKFNLKHLSYFLIFLSVFVLGFSIWKLLGDDNSDLLTKLGDTMVVYLFSAFPAFDVLLPASESNFGANSFRFVYAILHSLGLSSEPNKTIYEWTFVPYPTNVYTVMYPFFKDFGYWGLVIFGGLYGLIFELIYKLAIGNNKFFILLYAALFPALCLQFFGEYMFTNFSTYLQLAITFSLPYFVKIRL